MEARCDACHDTGSLSQHMDGFLDCRHCDAVENRLAMREHLAQFTAWPSTDTVAWAAYLFAQRQAASVAPTQYIHCQEFHELAMDYRGAGVGFVAQAYARLCEYIETRISHVAPQPALPKLPSTPEEVVEFIGGNCDSMDTVGAIEDRRISLTVHDLLSSFQDLADFAEEQPAQQVEAVGQVPVAQVVQLSRYHLGVEFVLDGAEKCEAGQKLYVAPQLEAQPLHKFQKECEVATKALEAQQAGDVANDALKVARAALHTAEYAIKGREHTGFITNAVAVIDAAIAQGRKA